ncbi:N-6 DNA methylase [Chitinophaga sp. 22321]|uniref:site-specific DNA-methyltransferase (adenine-specific) n=1 Tax=Chitinophaga hostae TaxID=2831022 RepID=A0ABS5IV09_9BACT|nr:N-6 DNA methylase [Chitinophaga hostae]MBS0026713.1 N-6 DNA methylase [Chitinophaga hostae]
MASIKSIHNKLGLNKSNGLVLSEDKDIALVRKIDKIINNPLTKPHSVFCMGDKPFILFYEKPKDRNGLFKAVWNLNEIPIVIIVEDTTVDIYNGFEYLKTESSLALISNSNGLSDFEYLKLVTGDTWEKYASNLNYKNRVDFKLLENIKAAREILINDCNIDDHTANALLGKSIFVRYLIDRNVRIGYKSDPKEWTTAEYCEILSDKQATFDFFSYLQQQFNGDLFQIEDSSTIGPLALNTVRDLLLGVTLQSGQLSLFDVFDFSIIPVEFISNVYELFIGHEEQATSGAYYTPLFLVEYIVSQTVTKYFEINKTDYNCKVLDPACGSGIFLVETLRVLIEKFNALNPNILKDSDKYREILRKISEDNIYGIDKDKSAVSVAIFSVYLTLLDYQSPRDIENFRFPKLYGKNFFSADFFDTNHEFNAVLKKSEFKYILGNPPWKRGGGDGERKPLFEKYIKQRKISEGHPIIPICISNNEIAQAFLLRVSDFSTPSTNASLIVTSKTLYNINAQSFRKYFLTNYLVDKIFELSPVRREVFNKSNDPAIAPAVIIFYKYAFGTETNVNYLDHYSVKPNRFFSLFNLFVINRTDIKKVSQNLLLSKDWLWKTLLYGHYLDYNFLLRLEGYQTIDERILEKKFLKGQGFQNGSDKNPVGDLAKLKLLSPDCIQPFFVRNDLQPFKDKHLHRIREKQLYYGIRLLIKKGLTNELKSVAAICDIDCLYKDSVTGVKANVKEDLSDLRNISGLMQSDLFSYYAIHKFSSPGVEREQAFNEEKFSFPFSDLIEITGVVQEIEEDLALHKNGMFRENQQNVLRRKLNLTVYEALHLSNIEKALVDFTTKYTIPSILQKNCGELYKTIQFKDEYLEAYINVFYSKFSNIFNNKKSFNIEVWHTSHVIGIFFRVDSLQSQKSSVEWLNKANDDLLKLIISLGHDKISDKLFIQKDVRGFEKDYFYIFKPNERKVWHKALAYLDLNDFMDAILKTGKTHESI